MEPLELHLEAAHLVLEVPEFELAAVVGVALRLESAVRRDLVRLDLRLFTLGTLSNVRLERLELVGERCDRVLVGASLGAVLVLRSLELRLELLLLVERGVRRLQGGGGGGGPGPGGRAEGGW